MCIVTLSSYLIEKLKKCEQTFVFKNLNQHKDNQRLDRVQCLFYCTKKDFNFTYLCFVNFNLKIKIKEENSFCALKTF